MNYDALFQICMYGLPVVALVYYTQFEEDNIGIYSKAELNGIMDELMYGCCRLILSMCAASFLVMMPMIIGLICYMAVYCSLLSAC